MTLNFVLLIPYSFLQSLQFKANFLICLKKKCFFLDIFSFFSTVNTDVKNHWASLLQSYLLWIHLLYLDHLLILHVLWQAFYSHCPKKDFFISFNAFYFSSSVYFALSLLCFCTYCNLPFLLLFGFFLLRNSLKLLFLHVGFLFTFFQVFLSWYFMLCFLLGLCERECLDCKTKIKQKWEIRSGSIPKKCDHELCHMLNNDLLKKDCVEISKESIPNLTTEPLMIQMEDHESGFLYVNNLCKNIFLVELELKM